jgi:hypothetical protein
MCLCVGDKVYDPGGCWLGKLGLEAVSGLLDVVVVVSKVGRYTRVRDQMKSETLCRWLGGRQDSGPKCGAENAVELT